MSSDSSASIPLAADAFVEVARSPYIYEVAGARTMVTAIRNCDARRTSSTAALWRQLLVGLKDISVTHQERLEADGKEALLSIFTASLDDEPIRMACYTLTDSHCVTDYVMWQDDRDQTASPDAFEAGLAELEDYVRAMLSDGKESDPPRQMVNSFRSSDEL